MWFLFRILQGDPKKELLRAPWVALQIRVPVSGRQGLRKDPERDPSFEGAGLGFRSLGFRGLGV